MKLLLIRHAAAEPHDWSRWTEDSARPLTAEGIEAFTRSARRLGSEFQPDIVLSSPFLRAVQTAEILRSVAGWPEATLAEEIADGDYSTLVADHLERGTGAVAMVGHEPAISGYIAQLITGNSAAAIRMQPGSAALINVESPELGQLEWLAPTNLF